MTVVYCNLVVVQSLSRVWVFATPWTAHSRFSCPSLSMCFIITQMTSVPFDRSHFYIFPSPDWGFLPYFWAHACFWTKDCVWHILFLYFQLCCVPSAQIHLSSVPCSAPFPRFLDKWLFSRSSKVGLEIKHGTVKKPGTLKSPFHSLWLCLALPYFGQPLEGTASLLSCKYCQEAPVASVLILFPRTFTILPFLFRWLARFFKICLFVFFLDG